MYIEKRKSGQNTKYYLVHSYREGKKVRKIRKYLGSGLSPEELSKAKVSAKKMINQKMSEELVFNLSADRIEMLNGYGDIEILHLSDSGWERFRDDFIYSTNAIEGSSVKRENVREILYSRTVRDDDELEAKGVAEAVEYIRKIDEPLSLPLIKKLHKFCFRNTKPFAGKLRQEEVVIRTASGKIIHEGIPAENVEDALEDMILWVQKDGKKFRPLALAAIVHNHFEYIHPFEDGNGRVGRLLLNFILIKSGYPPVNISVEDRREYYETLKTYSQRKGMMPTLKFLIKQYNKSGVSTTV